MSPSPPGPEQAGNLDELVEGLRLLKVWAGDPSYGRITERINAAWLAAGRPASELARKNTVADCFKTGRRRVNTDLLIAIVQALHPDVGYVTQWHQALRVIGGEVEASAQVRVQDALPPDLADFTGRTPELGQLGEALHHAQRDGGAVVISAIEGMAGVGKTELAVHAGHLLLKERPIDRVLFVNLRGFHPDPAQPPADPAAVLDGFLRLLGVPGQKIPHDLQARAAAYRSRLAGTHALVVLDNAADAEQVRPLLAGTPGCLTLVTSRRSLADLNPATRLVVDVFTPDEALHFLKRAVPEVTVGEDPTAAARIAARCGHLPLALNLVAGHIRSTPGWTLTDHADRLDERHHHGRLDDGVALALDLSYQHLPADQQRLLRVAALHPGQDLDAYAVAALTDLDLPTARGHLQRLCSDHLLQQGSPGRYGFHDLVRAHAADRAIDEDRPAQRHTALTRLFVFYLATAAAAVDVVYPYERQRRPAVSPAGTVTPDLADHDRADRWLDTELANLLAVAQQSAALGLPEHTWQLSGILDRHLRIRGRYHDARSLHQQALHLARQAGNRTAEMNALNSLGSIDRRLSRLEQAGEHHERALQIAREIGDPVGELNALNGLGTVHVGLGRYPQAVDDYERAVHIAQAAGDAFGERTALTGLGDVTRIMGGYQRASDYHARALQISQAIGDRRGELAGLGGVGTIHRIMGRYQEAGEHLERAVQIAQAIFDRVGEMYTLNGLAAVHRRLGRDEEAAASYRQALHIARETGDRSGEQNALYGLGSVHRTLGRNREAAQWFQQVLDLARQLGDGNWQYEALQGLGRLHYATGRPDLALTHHEQALKHAIELAQAADQARAHDGVAQAHHTLGHHEQARQHWQHALDILTSLGADRTEEPEVSVTNLRAHLGSPDPQPPD